MGDLFIKDFPPDLHRELKIRAAQEGTSLKGIIIELLWQALKEQPTKKRKEVRTR